MDCGIEAFSVGVFFRKEPIRTAEVALVVLVCISRSFVVIASFTASAPAFSSIVAASSTTITFASSLAIAMAVSAIASAATTAFLLRFQPEVRLFVFFHSGVVVADTVNALRDGSTVGPVYEDNYSL